MEPTSDQNPAPEPPPPPDKEKGRDGWDDYVSRAKEFAKEHPAAAVAIAAGTGALVAAQFTVGALVGLGAAVVIGHKIGPEKREEVLRKSEELLARTKEQGQRAFEEGRAQAERLLREGQRLWPFGPKGPGRGKGKGSDDQTGHPPS